MNKKDINIVYSSDDNYSQPLGVSMHSLLDNFQSDKYQLIINILDGDIKDENKVKLTNIGKIYKTKINFIKVNTEIFADFPQMYYYTLPAYYRLCIPDILKDVEKCIYIDCDTLVIGNIEGLYENSLDCYLLAAVEDSVAEQVLKMNCPFFKYIKKYFNSGILLMNLDKMRQEDFTAKAIEFVKKHSKELIYADQDVLNFLCIDKWLPLEKKWNLQVDRSQTRVKPDPIILHYTTGYKPWCRFYNNYYQRFYKHYLKKWPEYKIKETTTLIAAKQIIKFIPYSVPIVRFLKKFIN